jgi:hypothetical protein
MMKCVRAAPHPQKITDVVPYMGNIFNDMGGCFEGEMFGICGNREAIKC